MFNGKAFLMVKIAIPGEKNTISYGKNVFLQYNGIFSLTRPGFSVETIISQLCDIVFFQLKSEKICRVTNLVPGYPKSQRSA